MSRHDHETKPGEEGDEDAGQDVEEVERGAEEGRGSMSDEIAAAEEREQESTEG
jgi:hypothetical protein